MEIKPLFDKPLIERVNTQAANNKRPHQSHVLQQNQKTPQSETGDEPVTLTPAALTITEIITRQNEKSLETQALTSNSNGDGKAIPPLDEARVAELRSAIAEGRYPIDNERLANKLIQWDRLLS
jgi:negative regulator of flagellin synthesis FlgM